MGYPSALSQMAEYHNTLLDPAGVIHANQDAHQHLIFCPNFHHHLSKGQTPPLALANMMYVGKQPPEL